MITAKGETFDKVLGLELGADDYVVSLFDTKEIVARIKAVMRRTGKNTSEGDVKEVRYDKLVVNMTKYELKVDGKIVDTLPKGWSCSITWPTIPTAFTPEISCWMRSGALRYYSDSRTVDVHIKRLQEKSWRVFLTSGP